MDRALQERLIGAIVLVVVAVLIVPVFLDGPASDVEMVSESVSLPGQKARQAATQKIVLNRDRTEPLPANTLVSTANAGAQSARREAPAATESLADSATSPVSSTGMWVVQLGSFSSQENADRLAASLRQKGYAAFLSRLETASGALHRVRIGPQENRASAESVAARLGNSGHAGQVVPHP